MSRHWEESTIFTIGHSTHSIEEFVGILKAYEIGTLVDIRTVPHSRHNPQFGQDALVQSMESAGVAYHYLKDLGGLRNARKDSPNAGWRNLSFRGYADHMQTEPFRTAIGELVALGTQSRSVIMCAEALPWRCHRSLVGDALLVRSVPVEDIMSAQKSSPHKLTNFARATDTQILYPSGTNET